MFGRQLGVAAIAAALFVAVGPSLAGGVAGQGTWETTLQPRDINGDGTVDAFFDTALHVTWLANAKPFSGDNWLSANAWAKNLSVYGVSGWRLPTMKDTFLPPVNSADGCNYSMAGGTDCGYNVQTKSGDMVYSEMAYLFHVTLGNKSICPPGNVTCSPLQDGAGLTNTAHFVDLGQEGYWSGLEYAPDMSRAWYFEFRNGAQLFQGKLSGGYSMAVRDGDVYVVPEPSTNAMVLAGLAVVAFAASRRRINQ